MHCTDAACVKVCPSGCAVIDEETGFVTYDPDKCIGCQYCRSACPFDVPRHTGIGISGADIKINKCTGCPDRIAHDMEPACVHTCQPGALQFGPRDEMLERAEKRVEWLKQKGFDKARVYGKDQMGGTARHPRAEVRHLAVRAAGETRSRAVRHDARASLKPLAGAPPWRSLAVWASRLPPVWVTNVRPCATTRPTTTSSMRTPAR